MSVYPGFGVNYKAAQANWATDFAYFKQIKSPVAQFGIRPNLTSPTNPWTAGNASTVGSYAFWRACALYFQADPSFYVSFGGSGPTGTRGALTATLFNTWSNLMTQEAQYMIQQGYSFGDFNLGNEMELDVDGTTLTQAGLRSGLRTLASNIKALSGWSNLNTPISYSCIVTTVADGRGAQNWAQEGLGAIDLLSIHPYGTINLNAQSDSLYIFTLLEDVITALGSSCYISEFGLDGSSTNVFGLNPINAIPIMKNILSTYIIGEGFNKFMVYSWVGSLNADDQFAFLNTNGSLNPVWSAFFQSGPIIPYTPRTASTNRSTTYY